MVRYFFEDTSFKFKPKALTKLWLRTVAGSESRKLGDVNIIFCSDNYILDINMKYLQHDYFTDIITFGYSEGDVISGDIYISLDTVKSNSEEFHVDYINEFYRVIIHGVLHLCGQNDKTDEERAEMIRKENAALALLNK